MSKYDDKAISLGPTDYYTFDDAVKTDGSTVSGTGTTMQYVQDASVGASIPVASDTGNSTHFTEVNGEYARMQSAVTGYTDTMTLTGFIKVQSGSPNSSVLWGNQYGYAEDKFILVSLDSAGVLRLGGVGTSGDITYTIPSISYTDFYHVVVTINGSNRKMYVNGVEVGTSSSADVLDLSDSIMATGLYMQWTTEFYPRSNCDVCCLGLYSKELTSVEVLELYESSFTTEDRPTAAATERVDTSYMSSLQAGYLFNETSGTTSADILDARDLTLSTHTTSFDGLEFDGTQNALIVGASNGFNISTAVTISMRYTRDSLEIGETGRVLGFHRTAGSSLFGISVDDGYILFAWNDGSYGQYVESKRTLSGTATMTLTGSSLKCYVNGLEVHSASVSFSGVQSQMSSGNHFSIGGFPGNAHPFEGTVNYALVFNEALTETQVHELFGDTYKYLAGGEVVEPTFNFFISQQLNFGDIHAVN